MRQTKQRALGILLALVMLAGLLSATALAAPITFTDVPANAWYFSDVQKAVDTGLVSGYPDNTFGPDKNLTYAEAIKLAAVMYKYSMTGATEFEAGSPWYQPYVNFAKNVGIIRKDYDWNKAATRAGYMEIFAGAIPDIPALAGVKGLTAINEIADGAIPDVPMTHPQAAAIYKLYRAGVLQGSDKQHSCKPESNIRRSEVAAILTRMMNSAERIYFSMGEKKPEAPIDTLAVANQPKNASAVVGGEAFFLTDVTGGKAPYTYEWYYKSSSMSSFAPCAKRAEYYEWFEGVKAEKLTVKILDDTLHASAYYCVVTDADGKSVTSDTALLSVTVESAALKIENQPQSYTGIEGSDVDFFVSVSGGKAPYQFQWYYCNTGETKYARCEAAAEWYERYRIDSNGGNYSLLTVREVGAYMPQDGATYYCIVTDAAGQSVTSDTATLFIRWKSPGKR